MRMLFSTVVTFTLENHEWTKPVTLLSYENTIFGMLSDDEE